ncbi:hypothetical protein [Nocardia cyriacigeorgica]|uniref:imine reductase family protein n=1 Tax=Nocardia cyriacigeorgica TaxID=135487 RepID=UPI0024548763|nr:hypothetical protein [Nocardia cyriacigeorgica]
MGDDPGAAETHDLALLGAGYVALTGFLHAAALLTASGGVTPERFADGYGEESFASIFELPVPARDSATALRR